MEALELGEGRRGRRRRSPEDGGSEVRFEFELWQGGH